MAIVYKTLTETIFTAGPEAVAAVHSKSEITKQWTNTWDEMSCHGLQMC